MPLRTMLLFFLIRKQAEGQSSCFACEVEFKRVYGKWAVRGLAGVTSEVQIHLFGMLGEEQKTLNPLHTFSFANWHQGFASSGQRRDAVRGRVWFPSSGIHFPVAQATLPTASSYSAQHSRNFSQHPSSSSPAEGLWEDKSPGGSLAWSLRRWASCSVMGWHHRDFCEPRSHLGAGGLGAWWGMGMELDIP